MAANNDEFVRLTEDILEKRVPSLVDLGFEVARSRSLEAVGARLAEIYARAVEIRKKK